MSFGKATEGLGGVVDLMQVHSALFWQKNLSHFTSPDQRERERVGVAARAKKALEVWCIASKHTHTHTHS